MNLPDVQAPEGASKNFLKLKDGESVKGVFIGEIHTFHTKWINGKSVTTDNKDPDGKVRFRNNIVMIDPQTNELLVKIWEFPWSVFKLIKDINSEYPLETIKIKITRDGTGMDTTYSVLPLVGPKDFLSKEKIEAINNLPLHQLEKKASKNQAPSDSQELYDSSGSELPF